MTLGPCVIKHFSRRSRRWLVNSSDPALLAGLCVRHPCTKIRCSLRLLNRTLLYSKRGILIGDSNSFLYVIKFIRSWEHFSKYVCVYMYRHTHTRAVYQVRLLTSLLRVGTLWRCDDGLFFEVPPLASDALLTTLDPLLENVLQTVDHLEIGPFSWLERPRNRMGVRSGLYGGCSDGVPRIHFFPNWTQNSIQI
jgi:hypothetical protein